MISTFQALAVALLALLPGALYTFAFERVVGGGGATLADRLVRFLASSAFFMAVASGPGLLLYRHFIVTNRLAAGDVNGALFELMSLGYVAVPTSVGTLVGYGRRRNWRWVGTFVGRAPQPRAWDFLWRANPHGVVRVKLKSGAWLAGVFGTTSSGRRSFASGYPEPQDLYLSLQLQVDPADGTWVRDEQGRATAAEGESGLLLRWDEVEYLDFQEID